MTALEAALTIMWQGMLGIFAVMAPIGRRPVAKFSRVGLIVW